MLKKGRTVKQNNNYSCFACVAAMVAGKKRSDVYRALGHDGSAVDRRSEHPAGRQGFTFSEIAAYLAREGYVLGRGMELDPDEAGVEIASSVVINCEVKVGGTPAVLIVATARPGVHHVVFYDGSVVRDPDPQVDDARELHHYRVIELWPVTHVGRSRR